MSLFLIPSYSFFTITERADVDCQEYSATGRIVLKGSTSGRTIAPLLFYSAVKK
jgi:hypothetical protein